MKIRYIKNLESGTDYFNLVDGWTNKEFIIRLISFWYWLPVINKKEKVITWLRWQFILPR